MDGPANGPANGTANGTVNGTAMLRFQAGNGALVASPDFGQYRYCWLRDSSFAAYALDRCGQHEASARYHDWVNGAIAGIGERMDAAIGQRLAGRPVNPATLPPTRFGLDGSVQADDWPNFQIDGYGTWLWSLREHLAMTGQPGLPAHLRESALRAAAYLAAFALDPCYDVWEENPDGVHTSTLACVFGGLTAAAWLLGEHRMEERASDVQAHVRATGQAAGRYQKSSKSSEIDASMIWLLTPFGLVNHRDPLAPVLVREIGEQLGLDGGIRRYPSDTYFGGGAWPVLTASLGWHLTATGDRERARGCLDWVTGHIDADGRLGEQFGGERRLPQMYREWVGRWGHPARDLLWSHAMAAVLSTELGAGVDGGGDEPAYLQRQK